MDKIIANQKLTYLIGQLEYKFGGSQYPHIDETTKLGYAQLLIDAIELQLKLNGDLP